MRNRVRQSRTLGSVRGGDGAATVTPTRARSRKRWIHAKGKPTAATGPLLLGNIEPIILKNKIEEQLALGAIGFGPRSFCLWKYQEGKTRTSDSTTVTVGASMRMTRHLATSRLHTAATRVTATIPAVAISNHAWNK